jgi:hypothetical protein
MRSSWVINQQSFGDAGSRMIRRGPEFVKGENEVLACADALIEEYPGGISGGVARARRSF